MIEPQHAPEGIDELELDEETRTPFLAATACRLLDLEQPSPS
jgi:hypothetical protein